MDEELGLGREIIVDDIVQEGQVYSTRGHVCDNQNGGDARSEFAAVNAPCCLRSHTRMKIMLGLALSASSHNSICQQDLLEDWASWKIAWS